MKIAYKNTRQFLNAFFPENIVNSDKFLQQGKLPKQQLKNFRKMIQKAEENIFESVYLPIQHYKNYLYQKRFFEAKIEKFSYDTLLLKKAFTLCHENGKDMLYSLEQLQNTLLRKPRKFSDYKIQLRERKKLSILYGGLSRKHIQKAYDETKNFQGVHNENMILYLERRLDVVLYRIFFFPSIKIARQYIHHKKVYVNAQVMRMKSYVLQAGDCIQIDQKCRKALASQYIQRIRKKVQKRSSQKLLASERYITVNEKLFFSMLSYHNLSALQKKMNRVKFKKFLYRKKTYKHRMFTMNLTAMKALYVEVSYKLFQAIVLYSPQKLMYPSLLDIQSIKRSLKHS